MEGRICKNYFFREGSEMNANYNGNTLFGRILGRKESCNVEKRKKEIEDKLREVVYSTRIDLPKKLMINKAEYEHYASRCDVINVEGQEVCVGMAAMSFYEEEASFPRPFEGAFVSGNHVAYMTDKGDMLQLISNGHGGYSYIFQHNNEKITGVMDVQNAIHSPFDFETPKSASKYFKDRQPKITEFTNKFYVNTTLKLTVNII